MQVRFVHAFLSVTNAICKTVSQHTFYCHFCLISYLYLFIGVYRDAVCRADWEDAGWEMGPGSGCQSLGLVPYHQTGPPRNEGTRFETREILHFFGFLWCTQLYEVCMLWIPSMSFIIPMQAQYIGHMASIVTILHAHNYRLGKNCQHLFSSWTGWVSNEGTIRRL